MSYDFNYKFWVATAQEIEDVRMKEKVYQKLSPISERLPAHDIFAELYSDYMDLVNKLGRVYSKTFQVQKREIITKLVEAASNRLLELRQELKNIEFSEFIYVDKALIQRKLTPADVNIVRPPYFPFWRPYEIQKIIKGPRISTEDEAGLTPLQLAQKRQKEALTLSPEEKARQDGCTLIQIHELARQNRIFRLNMRYHPDKYKPKPAAESGVINYEFTHKPDQTMLLQIKRTVFEADYYLAKTNLADFHFYAPPVDKEKTSQHEIKQDAISESSTLSFSETSISKFLDSKLASKRQIAFRATCSAEPYFLEGIYHVSDPDVRRERERKFELKRLEFLRKVCAKRIQKAWKDYTENKYRNKRVLQEKILCGLVSERMKKKTPLEDAQKRSSEDRLKVERHQEEFAKICADEKNRILQVKTPWIMLDISDHIRDWFREFYDGCQDFHPYPDAWRGGTILVLTGETMTIQEFVKDKAKPMTPEEKEKIKKKLANEKKALKNQLKRQAEKLALQKKKAMDKGEAFYNFEQELPKTPYLPIINENMDKYNDEWRFVDEKTNRKESPFMNWIKADKFAEVHKELRLIVDEMMKIEYHLLKQALGVDTGKKYKIPPEKPEKKKGGGRGKKKEKDMTADRAINELYYEMQDSGLIMNYKRRCFEEFIGDYNYVAYEIRNYFLLDASPSLGEIKTIFQEWIFGMGPLNLPRYKSILIAGPVLSGKSQLCEIIASEIDAVVFNLSPEIVRKYASDLDYMVHLVVKMSKILQPTVLFIENVHRTFWKSVPPEFEYLQPTLVSDVLKSKILKAIKPEDRIFILATTDEPWTAKNTMNTLFDKIILLPKPDYSTSFILWRNLSLQYSGVPRDFEFSPLTKVTQDYSSGAIHDNVAETLKIVRRTEFTRNPLKCEEYLETFFKQSKLPIEEQDFDVYQKWYNRVSKLAKQRVAFMKKMDILRAKLLRAVK